MTARPVPRFSTPVLAGPGDDLAFCTMGTGSFRWVKRPGRGVNHQPPSSAEVKDTVELYVYLPPNPPFCVCMAGYRVKFTCAFVKEQCACAQ